MTELRIEGRLGRDGIWAWRSPSFPAGSRPGLLLDRDGVVVEHVPYLHWPAAVVLLPGAAALIAAANRCGVAVAVVTNQSGVGRGYYGWREFGAVMERVQDLLADQGGAIDAVFACPYHRDGRGAFARDDHPGRKPNPGMVLRAAHDLQLDLARTCLVGDSVADVRAGLSAGVGRVVHVLTGVGGADRAAVAALAAQAGSIELADDLGALLARPLRWPA